MWYDLQSIVVTIYWLRERLPHELHIPMAGGCLFIIVSVTGVCHDLKKKQFGGRFRPLFTVNIEDKMELFGEMTQWKESKMYQQKMQKVLRTGQKWMNCLGRRLTLWFYRMVICKRVTNYMRTMV
jgi:hypothetical protein